MRKTHPLAGKTVKINLDGTDYSYNIEDWWENVGGQSWQLMDGNPACLKYAMRAAFSDLPLDDEVVYGKISGLGELMHVSELQELDTD